MADVVKNQATVNSHHKVKKQSGSTRSFYLLIPGNPLPWLRSHWIVDRSSRDPVNLFMPFTNVVTEHLNPPGDSVALPVHLDY